jgi:hypothetical protein
MNPVLPILRAALAFALLAAPAVAAAKGGPAPARAHAVPAARAAAPTPAPADSAASVTPALTDDALFVRALDRMVGVVPGSDSLVAWDLFREHPQRTVELILPTLKPVKRDLYLGAPNMVWRVRVLQRITGMEFRAPTRARLTEEERTFLAPDSTHGVRFAGEDRGLGMTRTAPADAQKAIFEKWRKWWSLDAKKPELPIVAHEDERTWWY